MLRLLHLALIGLFAAGPCHAQSAGNAASSSRLPKVSSWGYQLQRADPAEIARSPFDLVVIDYSHSADDEGRFTPSDLARMKVKPDGSRRVVLAYMSIGEAENYRFYWNEEWVEQIKVVQGPEAPTDKPDPLAPPPRNSAPSKAARSVPLKTKSLHLPRLSAPVWLGRENETWSGNFLVRYWEKGWQDIIFGSKDSYLARIVAAGFDGVYLDRVDVFYSAERRPTAKEEMIRFVVDIAEHARQLNPQFAVVPQNAEELILDPRYLAAIDGVAKEDLFYGYNEGQPNPPTFVATSLRWLAPARLRGLPVLVVEYVLEPAVVERVRSQISDRGFVPYFADRQLDRLFLPDERAAAPGAPPGTAPPAPTQPAATEPAPQKGRGKSLPKRSSQAVKRDRR
jgi:cysteinyl-tRNA synthetase